MKIVIVDDAKIELSSLGINLPIKQRLHLAMRIVFNLHTVMTMNEGEVIKDNGVRYKYDK